MIFNPKEAPSNHYMSSNQLQFTRKQWLTALLVLALLWQIYFTFSNLALTRIQYSNQPYLPSQPDDFTKFSDNHVHLGYRKTIFSRRSYTTAKKGSVLITSSINNEFSFGKGREFSQFYHMISTLKYPKESLTLSFYCGTEVLHEAMITFFDELTQTGACPYNKVTILFAPFLQKNSKTSDHNFKIQRVRRRNMALGRNFLVLNSLDAEEYTLFFDADIVKLDHTDMLTRFVKSGKDIVVPRIELGTNLDYDKNSWRGQRKIPSEAQLQLMNEDKWDEANFVPRDVKPLMFHLGDHLKSIKGLPDSDERRSLSYTVDLDSVGGAVLFAKSIIYKVGVLFSTMNVVGTSWLRKEGFDGIETEGLCYTAQSSGYKCFGMPNLVAHHGKREA